MLPKRIVKHGILFVVGTVAGFLLTVCYIVWRIVQIPALAGLLLLLFATCALCWFAERFTR